jgi:hypothetical protein
MAAATWPLALGLVACGGKAAPAVSPAPPASSSAAPVASAVGPTAPPGPTTPGLTPPAASATTSATPIAPPATPSNPPSTKATVKNDPAWATCHAHYEAKKKDVSKDVQAMAAACAKVTKMKLVGATLTGKQGDQDPPQTFPLKAEANHCYRVYAQASEGIRDLDLAIKDSLGALAGEDSTDDPSPVILEDGAVCFTEADSATIVVSVGLGKGTYAIEIWKD